MSQLLDMAIFASTAVWATAKHVLSLGVIRCLAAGLLTVVAVLLPVAAADDGWRERPVSIDPSIFQPYTAKGWPKLYAVWGDKGFKLIQKVREAGARKASWSTACDYVAASEYSDRSKHPNSVVVFVDCANGKRFFFNETDVPRP